ncbi:hypothetical protein [Roseibium sp.]|uniref:hypothetical protein n=1 Tax=Roseibium sp. TaxID=1936156 RepID=UPI00326702D1
MEGWDDKLGLESTAVLDLRRNDRVFDEICRDYEIMLGELARSRKADAADLEETVAALQRELVRYLASVPKHAGE